MADLKPCPFCGDEAVHIGIEDIMWCDNCQGQAPNAVWSARPGEAAARQEQFDEDCKAMCHYCRGVIKTEMLVPTTNTLTH